MGEHVFTLKALRAAARPHNRALNKVISALRKCLTHRLLVAALGVSILLQDIPPAHAIIDVALQMQLGNPSGAAADPTNHDHYLIQRSVEAIDYNDHYGQPNWASWDLTAADVGSSGRTDAWAVDTNLPAGFYPVPFNTYGSYNGTTYDRGHMCPSADRTDTTAHNELVFLMSNIIPQAAAQNQGVWANFETYCRSLLTTQELLIICGPSAFGPLVFDSGHVALASNTWKIVVGVPLGSGTALNRITNANPNSIRVIALRIPNTTAVGSSAWASFATHAHEIENETGLTFFTALPTNLAWVLRSKVDGQPPGTPSFTSFSPAGGDVGATVTITGTNLGFVTNVTFNGVSAPFTINSTTNLAATVPTGATSGQISVASLGGVATNAASFAVGASLPPDLAIACTHSGSFIQGNIGDTYTIIVTNRGGSASSGTVTVTETLPADLTATDISGAGWTASLGSLTCSRSGALAAGAAYPPIIVTVNVAANAAPSITNTASVSGGSDVSPANNTVSDTTRITAASAPTATTDPATAVGSTTATLNGIINPNGQPATVQFQYGTNAGYGSVASIPGTLSGAAPQAVSASLTGLVAGLTYHFRLSTTNVLGPSAGLDQTFTTTPAGVPDLAITMAHGGSFTQGDTGAVYTITITNVGTVASSGTVTVTDALPAGLTAVAISGTGWTTNVATLTCSRADALPAGAGYPVINVTVSVATNAPTSVTNTAVVSGGGETNPANNTAIDLTTINPATNGASATILAAWNMSSLSGGANNFGPSPMAPTTNAGNLVITGMTRGAGVGVTAIGAARGWGGNTWTNSSSAAAINSNTIITFTVAAQSGHKVSFASISRFDYRRSATGPVNGLLQCQVGSGAFANIAALSYPSNTSSGGSLTPIDLSGVPTLQDVGPGTNVTFRIVNWGGSSSAGTWYLFDVATNTAPDFVVQGSVSPAITPAPDLALSVAHNGSFTQGDIGDTYTILVTNLGNAASSGIVTVVDTLPAGLTAVTLNGSGWTADPTNLTCTRSDALAPGASYPPITVTVNVSAGTPASVTNVVAVSGGGDVSPGNNSAQDPTTVLPATAPAVITGIPIEVGTSTATLNGVVNPNGQPSTVQFQYGLTAGYDTVLVVPGTISGTTTQVVSASLPGLLPGTTYHFRIAATNILGLEAGQDQVFTTRAPIEAWRLLWFGTNANSGPAADTAVATSDGMPNLLKYALGLDPLVATNSPVAGDIATGYLRLTTPKNPEATDVSFHVEVTSDLATGWTTNGTTLDTETSTLLQVHDNLPVATSDGRFIRLRVSRP